MSGGAGFLPSTVSPVERQDKKPASNPCNLGRVTPERTKVIPADAKAMQQWRMGLGEGNQEDHCALYIQIPPDKYLLRRCLDV